MANAVFIPFNTVNSAEHIQSTAGGYTSEIVDTLSNNLPRVAERAADLQLKPLIILAGWGKIAPDRIVCADSPSLHAVLSTLGVGDALYIRGHCEAGSSVLQSSDHTANVSIPNIVALLNGNLPFAFPGKLKVYACESASSSGALWWKENSFASKLSAAMIAAGWNACQYFGYTEALSTYVVNGHKRRQNHPARASSVRQRVP